MSKPKQKQAIAVIPAPRTSAEERTPAARPAWQTRPCPPWCEVVHQDDDHYDDRYHFATPIDRLDLSLYSAECYDAGWQPGTLDLAISQHYRHAEPEIDLTVPLRNVGSPKVTGETELALTLAEARILRDRLSTLLAIAEESAQRAEAEKNAVGQDDDAHTDTDDEDGHEPVVQQDSVWSDPAVRRAVRETIAKDGAQ